MLRKRATTCGSSIWSADEMMTSIEANDTASYGVQEKHPEPVVTLPTTPVSKERARPPRLPLTASWLRGQIERDRDRSGEERGRDRRSVRRHVGNYCICMAAAHEEAQRGAGGFAATKAPRPKLMKARYPECDSKMFQD
jgi:hypothetical protein